MYVYIYNIEDFTCKKCAAGPGFFRLQPKKDLPIAFFKTYQVFKSQEGIICQTNLAERFMIGYF